MKITLTLLNALVAGSLAAPQNSDNRHHVTVRNVANPRWVKKAALDPSTKIPVRVALKQQNLDKGPGYLLEVSDPKSSKYGQHYSADEVTDLFAPSDDAVTAVTAWLVRAGIPAGHISASRGKGWLSFETTTAKLEDLLSARYHFFQHAFSTGTHIGADSVSLPSDVAQHVDFVTPGVVFSSKRDPSTLTDSSTSTENSRIRPVPAGILNLTLANALATDGCDTSITPACIRAMYNIPLGTTAAANNRLGIFATSGSGGDNVFSQADLNLFFTNLAPNVPFGTTPVVDEIDGATAPTDTAHANTESNLDLEMAMPIISPQVPEYYQAFVQLGDIFDTFLDAIDGAFCNSTDFGQTGDDPDTDGITPDEMCGVFTPAPVISFSYGSAEVDFPTNYLQRQCDEFMKLGLMGSTIVFASGDSGVARRSGPCLGPNEDIFAPEEPASCPFVVSVGSTTIPTGSSAGDPERATTRFSSGGGFSNIYPMPDYQVDTVNSYFSDHDPGYESYNTSNGIIPTSGGIFNRAGRGYPDMAAVGDNGLIAWQGGFAFVGGTSMAAPIAAAIFTRINEERINAGKSVIGFPNPVLYQNPGMFHDITVGDQDKGGPQGDTQPSACGNIGFSAVSGWDPVSGLGTPNYPAMVDVFMALV